MAFVDDGCRRPVEAVVTFDGVEKKRKAVSIGGHMK